MNIGYFSLNISFVFYLIWFIPQIFLNYKNKNTANLSRVMHGVLFIAYLTDFVYGFGVHMQWQYRTVTMVGLCSLAIQQFQFGQDGFQNAREKIIYFGVTALYFLVFCYDLYDVFFQIHTRSHYDMLEVIANICWLSYMMPQIVKNYQNKTTQGLSPYFVLFAIFLNVCDTTSAWALGWDYPNKIGPTMAFFGNSILLFQVFYYGKSYFPRLVDRRGWRASF